MPIEPQTARVLLIDDDESTFASIKSLLTELQTSFQLDWISTFGAARDALLRCDYDVYLLDYRLGQYEGVELLRSAMAAGCRRPVIMLTGLEEPEVDLQAMRAGAADYLVKGQFDAHRLERAIRYSIERWRLLGELERERYLLHTLLDNIPDNIYFKDSVGRYIRINHAKALRSGLTDPDEAIGKTDFDFFPTEHARKAQQDEQALMRSGEPLVGNEEQLTWPDGTESWVSTTKVPFRDQSGEVIGTLGVSRDITRLKLAQEELRMARDAAEAANRAKSDFLANISHEIRTPLNAILGMTELVLDTSLSGPQKEYLIMVRESGESLLAIMNDILDFSKIEAGKLELENGRFELRECVGDIMKSLGLRAHQKQLELAVRVASDVPEYLVGDRNRLRQILVNLVGNAIKFTEHGEVLVKIERAEAEDGVAGLHFEVADTGIGVSAEQLQRIFTAFEQADSSTTRRYGGTGLGLAIVSRLVAIMGGQLWAESTVGRGSQFHFTLCFGKYDGRLPSIAKPVVVLRGSRVLVVDDNATNRLILVEMLRNWGLVVTAAASARDAQKLVREALATVPFRLLVCDVQMPVHDGFELIGWMRSDPRYDLTIVMLTSGGRPEDFSRCQDLKVGSYLVKPVKQSELYNAIICSLGVDGVEDHALPHEPASPTNGNARLPLRILLAEDSIFNQRLTVALLEKRGHQVVVAVNGLEALQHVEAAYFDLVLMDVQMPEMDGFSATAAIRKREQITGQHLPIVAMTAHAMKGDREQCLAAGMDAYVSKPIHAADLMATIDAVTASRPRNAAAREVPSAGKLGLQDFKIDWQAALDRVEGRQALLLELVQIFFTEYPNVLNDIDRAIAEQQAPDLQIYAHRLKGCLRYFGESPAVETAREMETVASRGQVAEAAVLRCDLEHHVDQLMPQLKQFVNTRGSRE